MGENFISSDIVKEEIRSRISYLEDLIREIDRHIWKKSGYRLDARTNGDNSFKYYLIEKPSHKKKNPKRKYLKKREWKLAADIAQKEYEQVVKQCALAEISLLQNRYCRIQVVEEVYKTLTAARKNLVKPLALSADEHAKKWLEEAFQGLGFDETNESMFFTDAGVRVRSKSELIIATELEKAHIPYRYECPLKMGNRKVYPDFTVMNVRTRRILIWEHFGMVDDPEYQLNMMAKIQRYQNNGFVQGVNYIQTFEAKHMPLSTSAIKNIIQNLLM